MPRSAMRRNEPDERDHADRGKKRAVVEYGRVADAVPEQAGGNTGDELQQADRGVVPADAAGAQAVGHEARRQRLAGGAEYPLVQPVEHEQRRDHRDVLRQGKAQIADQKNAKRGEHQRE